MDKSSYVLIHVVNFQEFYAPLVLSQVFDQAEVQRLSKLEDSPKSVEVWIQVPFRVWFDSKFLNYKNEIKVRFPDLPIRYITGIDRLGGFPFKQILLNARNRFSKTTCIFHFRGDDLVTSWSFLKNTYTQDRFVADIRGLWPAEKLLLEGIEIFDVTELDKHDISISLSKRLINNLHSSDGLTSVSLPLLDTLKSMANYTKPAWVVPCCVLVPPFPENKKVKEKETLTIGYLGGTAVYQNLSDLVFPLFVEILKIKKINILILTHQPDKMNKLIDESNLSRETLIIKTLSQEQVGEELKGMDLGFLVRKKNLVNKVAQPVKIGEYLSAGVPVCVEEGLGGVEQVSKGVLKLNIEGEGLTKSAQHVVKYLDTTTREDRINDAHEAANQFFSWNQNVQTHQKNYRKLLNNQ